MPFFSFLFFFTFVLFVATSTLVFAWKYLKTKDVIFLKKLGLVWVIPSVLIALMLYAYYPITKERVVGLYQIDTNFYPGKNADWQKEHFSFEINENDDFLFHEKLKDGTVKTIKGKVVWFRQSPPMVFRIEMEHAHPLVDEYPTLHRGNRAFYYVFDSKFGNMFYRKIR
ncbi:hypothetical protein [uncultured Paraglaciecola sp.]|uniref:hypothetical protein n=1 Tax=uncultured Paraglaciecola sp. TaxID=1765024 RepID=UPI002596BB5A|nr:hypothetical protein [uncultured Paraglaciecola sp.]